MYCQKTFLTFVPPTGYPTVKFQMFPILKMSKLCTKSYAWGKLDWLYLGFVVCEQKKKWHAIENWRDESISLTRAAHGPHGGIEPALTGMFNRIQLSNQRTMYYLVILHELELRQVLLIRLCIDAITNIVFAHLDSTEYATFNHNRHQMKKIGFWTPSLLTTLLSYQHRCMWHTMHTTPAK